MDTTRVAETRKWGREPREGSEDGAPKSPTSTEATAKQATVIGVKRPREMSWSTDKNKGEQEPENPWQVLWCGECHVAVGVCGVTSALRAMFHRLVSGSVVCLPRALWGNLGMLSVFVVDLLLVDCRGSAHGTLEDAVTSRRAESARVEGCAQDR